MRFVQPTSLVIAYTAKGAFRREKANLPFCQQNKFASNEYFRVSIVYDSELPSQRARSPDYFLSTRNFPFIMEVAFRSRIKREISVAGALGNYGAINNNNAVAR